MTLPTIPLDVLEQAGCRCWDYQVTNGVSMTWKIDPMGMILMGEYAGHSVCRMVHWSDFQFESLPGELLLRTERAALQGLSD